ncbi:E3 ubiquitin protein ligase RIE1 [Zea mays]|uniref:RING-type E3 ubiquitin transferase n=1 Tax=Zea mays TaxID=4577 RepID=K7U4B1_MAIZE|nr:E3 ubiquitin protein ligase RIE1 [Zea mays]AQK55156.1 Putative RING zinc finger domain superfamily protein [Zea mays]|eukprot:XP_008679100.1 E3 ubiquitin protein ligase RIE1 [Zea mays]
METATTSPEHPLLRRSSPSSNTNADADSVNLSSPPPSAARPSRLAALIGRVGWPRGPSMMVHEATTLQLHRRRADWAHSRPVVTLDIAWNVACAAAAALVLASSAKDSPVKPLRLWLVGYAAQCLVHVGIVFTRLETRARHAWGPASDVESAGAGTDSSGTDSEDDETAEGRSSHASRCETINRLISFLWWIIGFYWLVSGGEVLEYGAPRLYWLTIVFLAFDVFFAVFCVAMSCFIGIALCCCLPCVVAILYALAGKVGASDGDISVLPRYRYYDPSEDSEEETDEGLMIPILNNSGMSTSERILLREDAECCVCLSSYEDGAELSALPCRHHFHWSCITTWLRMNATCPLCKYNILEISDSA